MDKNRKKGELWRHRQLRRVMANTPVLQKFLWLAVGLDLYELLSAKIDD